MCARRKSAEGMGWRARGRLVGRRAKESAKRSVSSGIPRLAGYGSASGIERPRRADTTMRPSRRGLVAGRGVATPAEGEGVSGGFGRKVRELIYNFTQRSFDPLS